MDNPLNKISETGRRVDMPLRGNEAIARKITVGSFARVVSFSTG